MMSEKTLHLPTQDDHITKDGIIDFYWPIGFGEISRFGRELEYRLSEFLREYDDQDEILSYKVLIKHYVCEVCGVFQGDLLSERTQKDNVNVEVNPDWLFYPYLLNQTSPQEPPIIKGLRKSAIAPNIFTRLKQPIRILKALGKIKLFQKNGMTIEGLTLSTPRAENLKNDIVTTQRTELIVMHAKRSVRPVFLCSSSRWFSEIDDSDLKKEEASFDPKISNQIFEIIKALYAEFELLMPTWSEKYLRETLCTFFSAVSIHRSRLIERDDIPMTVWTGTSGHIWDMMLRLETMRRGGDVTAHDHSGDRAHAVNFEMGWIEMYGADKFATFSQKQADTLKDSLKHWPILDQNPPEIIAVGDQKERPETKVAITSEDNKPVKKILLFSTLYDRDRGRGNPIFPQISYVDWQARLIGKLNEWGYQVYLKPHPESFLLPPENYETDMGVKIINGRFEDMTEEMDLYLFDFTQTSVFKPSILSGKPVVMIDFKGLEWADGAKESLDQRVEMMEGVFDQDNRIQVEWETLKSLLKTAPKKASNQDFIKKFYC